jgi:hypothetical protein
LIAIAIPDLRRVCGSYAERRGGRDRASILHLLIPHPPSLLKGEWGMGSPEMEDRVTRIAQRIDAASGVTPDVPDVE